MTPERESMQPRWRDLPPGEAIMTVLAPDLRFDLSTSSIAWYLGHAGYLWPVLGCAPTRELVARELVALEQAGRVTHEGDRPRRVTWKRAPA